MPLEEIQDGSARTPHAYLINELTLDCSLSNPVYARLFWMGVFFITLMTVSLGIIIARVINLSKSEQLKTEENTKVFGYLSAGYKGPEKYFW
jgi:hypothetical protein